jgi:ribonucleoside-diphosphate reductase alpha chain
MIEMKVSKDIWKMKYHWKNESSWNFYRRVANAVGLENGDGAFLENSMRQHHTTLAGRMMYALGTDRKGQTFSNCFTIPIKKDSLIAIEEAGLHSALTMQAGGGTGYNFSIIRPEGALIRSSKSYASGPVSYMYIFDARCKTLKGGGNRRGAQMGILNIVHPDIIKFITCKRDGSLKNFNLSVLVSDKFMQAVENNENWELKFPDISFSKYDEEWDGDFQLWESKGYPFNVYQTIPAVELFDLIMRSNYDYAEPGMIFEDTLNSTNSTSYTGERIQATNPCGEQPLIFNGSCNLASINLATMVDHPFEPNAHINFDRIQDSAVILTKALDKVLDINYLPLQAQKDIIESHRQIGIGVTGFADLLVQLGIPYSSAEAKETVENIMMVIVEAALETSIGLARKYGTFGCYSPEFIETGWAGKMFNLFPHLKEDAIKYGVRNSKLLSIAPTGTVSLVMNNVSGGIEPFYDLTYSRRIMLDDNTETHETVEVYSYALCKKLGYDPREYPFETAQTLTVSDHMGIQAAFQKYVDASISKTINVPVEYPFDDFKKIYRMAWFAGLKGTTTYRPNSIIGSVLSVTNTSKEQENFYQHWAGHERGEVVDDGVSLPSEYPMRGYIIKSEGKKWYFHVAFKDKGQTKPFAIFVQTNNKESNINTHQCIDALEKLALTEGIKPHLVEANQEKYKAANNVSKIARTVGLLLRHNVQIAKIVKTILSNDPPSFSFMGRLAKFLSQFSGEFSTGFDCPDCGTELKQIEGCTKCLNCGYSKC